jgi:hypothetical protein
MNDNEEKYVLIAWRSTSYLRSSYDRIYRAEAFGIDNARDLKRQLQKRFNWCDVEIYHSPKSGVMLLVN